MHWVDKREDCKVGAWQVAVGQCFNSLNKAFFDPVTNAGKYSPKDFSKQAKHFWGMVCNRLYNYV